MFDEDGNGSTGGRSDSGCLVVLQPHHVVERITNNLFGDHSGGHLPDPPRLIVKRPHQRGDGVIRPGVEEATKRPDPGPIASQSTLGTVDDGASSRTGQNAQEMLVNGAAIQDVDAARDDAIRSSTAALGLDALARSLLPSTAHAATLPRTRSAGNRSASGARPPYAVDLAGWGSARCQYEATR